MDRRLAPLLVLPALLLTGCSEVQDAASRTSDCVGLARDVASSGLAQTPTREEAEAAARRLEERVEQLDDPAVREAAGTLRDRLRDLQEAAASADPAAVQAAAQQARDAARATAETCGLPVDQFLQ